MSEIPKEIILRHAANEASKYFANRIETERKENKVAVLIRNLMDSLFFLPCNENGYPDYHQFNSLYIPTMELAMPIDMNKKPKFVDITAEEIQVIVEKPLIFNHYDSWDRTPVIFMWEGRCMNRSRIPIEKLNVKELMIVAQNAIKKREGLILDEVLKNKIYK